MSCWGEEILCVAQESVSAARSGNLEVEGMEETSFSPYPDKWGFPICCKGRACNLAATFLFSCVIYVPKDSLYGDSQKLRSIESHKLTRR